MPTNEPTPSRHELMPKEEKKIPKAAKLGVVRRNEDGDEVIYEELEDMTIKHAPGTFQINRFTKRSNGIFSKLELRNGRPFHEVKEDFIAKYSKKFHITCGGGSDYRYMELIGANYENFDLQDFFRRPSETDPSGTPMSLRDIYYYLFEDDIQRGPHNAVTDAKATLRCFFEGFCVLFDKEIDFSNAFNLKKLEKGVCCGAEPRKYSLRNVVTLYVTYLPHFNSSINPPLSSASYL